MSDPHNVLALMSLKGKVALITGATGHLGFAMASAHCRGGRECGCQQPKARGCESGLCAAAGE